MAGNYANNRKVKADRVYKTLGKMSWQRVVLGIMLLILIFFLAGTVSEFFLDRGEYKKAEACMVSERWMESYKPETKKLIDAGALYCRGDFDGACLQLADIELSELSSKRLDALHELSAAVAAELEAEGKTEAALEMRQLSEYVPAESGQE